MVNVLTKNRNNPFLDGLLDGVVSRLQYLFTGDGDKAHEREFGSPYCPYRSGNKQKSWGQRSLYSLGEAFTILPYMFIEGVSFLVRGNPGDR